MVIWRICVCICVFIYVHTCAFIHIHLFIKHRFSSVVQLCLTLCDPMDCSMPGLPVQHQLPEFTQTQVHWVGDAIQPSHPLLSPSPPAFNLSQNQGLFQWVSPSHQVAKVLEFQLQHQSSQSIWFPWGWTGWISLLSKGLSRVFWTWQFKSISSLVLSFLYSSTFMSIYDDWKNHSFDYMDLCWQVMSLLFNKLCMWVITFLPRSKYFSISWLQSSAAVIFEPPKLKSITVSTVSPSIWHAVMGPDEMILVFWMLSFKPTFSLSSFTFNKRLFSSSLSSIRVVSSAYLSIYWYFSISIDIDISSAYLLIFLPEILIPAYDRS